MCIINFNIEKFFFSNTNPYCLVRFHVVIKRSSFVQCLYHCFLCFHLYIFFHQINCSRELLKNCKENIRYSSQLSYRIHHFFCCIADCKMLLKRLGIVTTRQPVLQTLELSVTYKKIHLFLYFNVISNRRFQKL